MTDAFAFRAALALALAVAAPLVGCGSSLDYGDAPAAVTSIGPVFRDGEVVTVFFTTWDLEADPVNVELLVATGETFTPVAATAVGPRQLEGLIGNRGEHRTQTLQWRFADSGIADTSTIRLQLRAEGQELPTLTWGPAALPDLSAPSP